MFLFTHIYVYYVHNRGFHKDVPVNLLLANKLKDVTYKKSREKKKKDDDSIIYQSSTKVM